MRFPVLAFTAAALISVVALGSSSTTLSAPVEVFRATPGGSRATAGHEPALPMRLTTCGLFVEHPHPRSHTEVIGFKPFTTCSHNVTSITHTSKLQYWAGTTWLQAGPTFTGSNHGAKSYRTMKIEYACSGKQKTTWRGVTMTTIVYEHQSYSRWVPSAAVVLECRP